MAANRLITVCNDPFASAAETLVASVHRTSFDVIDDVIVYDLGLSEAVREELARMKKVRVRDFPREAYAVFPGYMDPGHYGYKLWMKHEASLYAEPGDRLWYVDAGVVLLRSAALVYELIEWLDIFAVAHDLSQTNERWTHARALELMQATPDERAAPQVQAGLFGFKLGGAFQELVDQAFAWSKEPEILLGSLAEHRFDQSILSTLCARYAVPKQPMSVFGEWRGTDLHPGQILYHHRREYDDHSGIRWRSP